MAQLSISQVTTSYQNHEVLKTLSLTLNENEIVALLGPSGCGKTTLLKAIAGLQPIDSGQIKIGDQQVSSNEYLLPSEKRKIGMIFQDYALFPHLTVEENIEFGISQMPKQQRAEIVQEMLRLVKLENLGERYPFQLSGGQQQRVAIARALAYQPDLVLLDEPFSNIDSQSRSEIMLEIRNILKQKQVAAVFVTHSKDEAFVFADKIAIFNQGKIEQLGTAQSLYSKPASPYVADFMGKSNYIPILSQHNDWIKTLVGEFKIPKETGSSISEKSQIMLRPEQLRLLTKEKGQFKVLSRIYYGSHWCYQVALADQAESSYAINQNSIQQSKHNSIEVYSTECIENGSRVSLQVEEVVPVLF